MSSIPYNKINVKTWNTQNPYLTALEAYRFLNWSVVPMYTTKTNDKAACVTWKELQKQAADEETIKAWETLHHPELWGVVTGEVSGIITLEWDGEAGRQKMEELGLHPHRRSGSGGYHQDFKHPGWRVKTVNNKSSKDRPWAKLYPGLDIRGDGGMCVFVGRNKNGKYEWLRDPEPDDLSILPNEIREALGLLYAPGRSQKTTKGKAKQSAGLLEGALSRVEQEHEGRNDVGFWLARQLRRSGLTLAQAEPIMRDYQSRVPATNAKGDEEEYTTDEALASLASAYGNKPGIVLGMQLDQEVDEILEALYEANTPPVIFVRGGCLTRVSLDEKGIPNIESITESIMLAHITRSADFFRYAAESDSYTNAHPSAKHAALILAQGAWKFPPLISITEVPVLRADGTILTTPGYDPETHLYYIPQPGLDIPSIPTRPTEEQIRSAVTYIGGFIGDFPYEAEADKANAYALLLTTVLRNSVRHVPMSTITATKPGTGKGLLTDVTAIIATGHAAASLSEVRSDEEWEKRITALLMAGTTFISIDNVEGVLRSAALSHALTCDYYAGRILGLSRIAKVAQRAVWIANGNNMQLGGDMPRRCYPIRMAVQVSDPWKREGFTYPNLIPSVAQERGKIIAALLTIIRGWWVVGKPAPTKKLDRLATFSEWADLIGGVLAYAGVNSFLENLEDMYKSTDVDGNAWALFLETWRAKLGDDFYTSKALIEHLTKDADFAETLPEPLGTLFLKEDKAFAKKFGNALVKKTGTPYGAENLRIVRGENDTHTQKATFKVAPFAPFAPLNYPYAKKSGITENQKIGYVDSFHNGEDRTVQRVQRVQNGHDTVADEELQKRSKRGRILATPRETGESRAHHEARIQLLLEQTGLDEVPHGKKIVVLYEYARGVDWQSLTIPVDGYTIHAGRSSWEKFLYDPELYLQQQLAYRAVRERQVAGVK